MRKKLRDEFQQVAMPGWLSEILRTQTLPAQLPLQSILDDSCFYPASGLDITPIAITAGHIHSFVYCDYSIKRAGLSEFISNGICGYTETFGRFIDKNEIVPSWWLPDRSEEFDIWDGYYHRSVEARMECKPFGYWSVLERSLNDEGGKERRRAISLLFLVGDGYTCYQNLYLKNKIRPQVLSIIQPPHALGHELRDFFERTGHEGRWYCKTAERGQVPDKLLLSKGYIPFGNEYLWRAAYNYKDHYCFIGLFCLDKRTDAQKEIDKIISEKERQIEEEKKQIKEKRRQIAGIAGIGVRS